MRTMRTMRSFLLVVCVLAWPPQIPPGRQGPVGPLGPLGPLGPTWGALAAGVAAEGPPVLSPLIGPAQERDAVARSVARQQQYGPHHLRHQHHYGDPRLSSRHPAPSAPSTHSGDGVDGVDGVQQQLPAPATEAPRGPLFRPRPVGHSGSGHAHPAGSCQLNTEHLASVVSKSLEGVCIEKEMNDRFHNLATQLGDQLNVLKTMILNLEDKVGAMDIGIERAERRLLSAVAKSRCARGGPESEDDVGGDAEDDPPAPEEDDGEDYNDNPALVNTYRDGAQGPGAREEEVQRYNNTVHIEHAPQGSGSAMGNSVAGCGHGKRVYTYFWRVRNMDYKMTGWNHRRSLRSPSFYVWPGGYRMYLRMYPRQSGENVYFHVGLTRGEHDASLPWPFRLKHRLAVLDQVASMASTGPGSGPVDLVSRLWDPAQLCSGYNWQRPSAHTPDNYECVGLGFPQSLLRTRSYIRQDAALVKLTVCLSADGADDEDGDGPV